LSVRDYADDVSALVESLDSPPLVVGHSLGGLVAQLVAARTRHAGLVAATPAPAAGIFAIYPGTIRVFSGHYLQRRPWTEPLYPTPWKTFRRYVANTTDEPLARDLYSILVCESGRVTYVEIPASDHLVFHGNALPVTMGRIDEWMAQHRVLA
jgi:pimeloyl-ACP methyl ester carboxylesterase